MYVCSSIEIAMSFHVFGIWSTRTLILHNFHISQQNIDDTKLLDMYSVMNYAELI